MGTLIMTLGLIRLSHCNQYNSVKNNCFDFHKIKLTVSKYLLTNHTCANPSFRVKLVTCYDSYINVIGTDKKNNTINCNALVKKNMYNKTEALIETIEEYPLYDSVKIFYDKKNTTNNCYLERPYKIKYDGIIMLIIGLVLIFCICVGFFINILINRNNNLTDIEFSFNALT